MRVAKVFLLLNIVSLLYLSKLQGQYVSYGTDPWRQRWQQITTHHFKLIYPKAIDSLAQRYAWLLDTSYTVGSQSIGHQPARIPVVLHPDNVYANGVVVWAPSRMELYTTPPAQTYPLPWDKQLALHEFRHVAQTAKMNRGFMRGVSYVLGEQASGLWLLPVPKWFMEGDAVATETALSSSGRGRSAEFHMAYRALLLSDIDWSYDKWVNGSYKHNVPSIYHFGYQNVAYARYRYGVSVWDEVLDESSRRYFRIPAFGNALKKRTGLNLKQLRNETFSYLKQQWLLEAGLRQADTAAQYLTADNGDYTSYRSAVAFGDTGVISLKTNKSRASSMVYIGSNQKEKRLFDHGTINGRIAKYRGKLYWSESVSDPRWEQRSYANIKSFDVTDNTLSKHTRKARYFALAFNDSLSYYAASNTTREGKNMVHLLDAATDTVLKQLATPFNSQAYELAWINTDGELAALLLNESGMGIYAVKTGSGEWSVLLPESYVNLSGISRYKDFLLFESGYDGINNIYALNTVTKKVYKATSARFGAFDAASDNDMLYFSDYQLNGHRIAQKELNPQQWQEVDWNSPYRFALADTLAAQERFNIDTVAVANAKAYESKPYRKLQQLFRFHSWMPLYTELDSEFSFDPDELVQAVKPGFTLLSQNTLSTATTRLGYSYENGYSAGHASFTYRGWYPVVDITADYGGGKQLLVTEGTLSKGDENIYDIGANIYIPLSFNGTRSLSGLIPQVNIRHSNDSYYVPSEESYQSEMRLDLFLQHYIYSRQAVRDIYPRWGYRILLAHRSMPLDTENFGTMYGGRLTVYTPGLLINHGLKLTGTIQHQDVKRYYISGVFSRPRGYSSFISKKMQFVSADYALPVAYPDFNLGSLLYVKRLHLNLFTDVGEASYYRSGKPVTTTLFSYGMDIIADYHVARKEFPFITGVRLVKPRNSRLTAELLFNVSF